MQLRGPYFRSSWVYGSLSDAAGPIIVSAPAEEALRQADQATALGQRLFRDLRGPCRSTPIRSLNLLMF